MYELARSSNFCCTGAAGSGPGAFNIVSLWVTVRIYLSLGLHVSNPFRPTPLIIIFVVVVVFFFYLIGWAAKLGPGSYPDFLPFYSLRGKRE